MTDEAKPATPPAPAPTTKPKSVGEPVHAIRPSPKGDGPDERKTFSREDWEKRDRNDGWIDPKNVTDVPQDKINR